jgi:hypothetical protein
MEHESIEILTTKEDVQERPVEGGTNDTVTTAAADPTTTATKPTTTAASEKLGFFAQYSRYISLASFVLGVLILVLFVFTWTMADVVEALGNLDDIESASTGLQLFTIVVTGLCVVSVMTLLVTLGELVFVVKSRKKISEYIIVIGAAMSIAYVSFALPVLLELSSIMTLVKEENFFKLMWYDFDATMEKFESLSWVGTLGTVTFVVVLVGVILNRALANREETNK